MSHLKFLLTLWLPKNTPKISKNLHAMYTILLMSRQTNILVRQPKLLLEAFALRKKPNNCEIPGQRYVDKLHFEKGKAWKIAFAQEICMKNFRKWLPPGVHTVAKIHLTSAPDSVQKRRFGVSFPEWDKVGLTRKHPKWRCLLQMSFFSIFLLGLFFCAIQWQDLRFALNWPLWWGCWPTSPSFFLSRLFFFVAKS